MIVADILSLNINGKSEGHYFSVANNYYELFKDKCEVMISGGPVYCQKFKNIIKLNYDTNNTKLKILNKIKVLLNARHIMKEAGSDILVFQCSAVSTILLSLLLFKTNAKIYLIQYDKVIMNSKLKRLLYRMVKRKISGIICPGDEIGESLEIPYCVLPDYIYTGGEEVINCKSTEYDFGIYGILAKGKGIVEVAEYLSKFTYKVMIAGKVGSLKEDEAMIEELKKICKNSKNITLKLGYLSDEDYDRYICKTKYTILNYSESYALRSSGVIFDIIYRGRPVIAKNRKYVEFVKENQIGMVYDNLKDINWDELMTHNIYSDYQNNIRIYLEKQSKVVSKLVDFLLN